MRSIRFRLGLVVYAVAAVGGLTQSAEPPRTSSASQPALPSLVDIVQPAFREAVASVVRQPTLSVKASEDEFPAHTKVYDWLLEHPDRCSLAWRRLQVPCVEITDTGKGKFAWADGSGSELNWQAVGRFPDGLVWYATGKVKPGPLMPTVPVKAVAVLHAVRKAVDDDSAMMKPTISVYLLTDSRAANAVLRIVGPAAPRMAEQGAEQLLLFFSGVAEHLHRHPEKVETVLAPPKK